MSESLTEVEYLRRDNKRLRQQCSAEGKEMYVERLKDGLRRAEQRELEACNEADTLRLGAERYEKLKEFHKSTDRAKWDDLWNSYSSLDAAVDALPDPNENSNGSR